MRKATDLYIIISPQHQSKESYRTLLTLTEIMNLIEIDHPVELDHFAAMIILRTTEQGITRLANLTVYKESISSNHHLLVLHLYAGALRVSVRIRPRSCFCWLKTIT